MQKYKNADMCPKLVKTLLLRDVVMARKLSGYGCRATLQFTASILNPTAVRSQVYSFSLLDEINYKLKREDDKTT